MDTIKFDQGQDRARRKTAAGVLNLNKPSGITSREVVDQVVRSVTGCKVGHAGTLDPLASGVLIVCVGPATRLVEPIQKLPKSYRTTIHLGARSDTLDADGRIQVEDSPRVPTEHEVEQILPRFLGNQSQQPPVYSALKIKGRRAYDLVRAGKVVELAPRLVRIDRLVMLRYVWPLLELEIDCGSGTYVRSIARDIGEILGCGGYVEILTRTRIGPFHIDQAVDPRILTADSIDFYLRPMLDGLPDLPRITLDDLQVEDVAHGRKLSVQLLGDRPLPAGEVVMVDLNGKLIAIAEYDPTDGSLQPRKVLI